MIDAVNNILITCLLHFKIHLLHVVFKRELCSLVAKILELCNKHQVFFLFAFIWNSFSLLVAVKRKE